jgi:hypothetical protein
MFRPWWDIILIQMRRDLKRKLHIYFGSTFLFRLDFPNSFITCFRIRVWTSLLFCLPVVCTAMTSSGAVCSLCSQRSSQQSFVYRMRFSESPNVDRKEEDLPAHMSRAKLASRITHGLRNLLSKKSTREGNGVCTAKSKVAVEIPRNYRKNWPWKTSPTACGVDCTSKNGRGYRGEGVTTGSCKLHRQYTLLVSVQRGPNIRISCVRQCKIITSHSTSSNLFNLMLWSASNLFPPTRLESTKTLGSGVKIKSPCYGPSQWPNGCLET